MKQKLCALLLALTLTVSTAAPALAAGEDKPFPAGTQTVTAKVTSKPDYVLNIPADVSVPRNTGWPCIGSYTVAVNTHWRYGQDAVRVTWSDGTPKAFTSTTPGAESSSIPYRIFAEKLGSPADSRTHSFADAAHNSVTQPLYLSITPLAWSSAAPGEYHTTVTYTSKIVPIH